LYLFALESKGFFRREEIEDVLRDLADFGSEQRLTDLAGKHSEQTTQSGHVAFRNLGREIVVNGATAKQEDDLLETRTGVVYVVVNTVQFGPDLLSNVEIFPARRGAVRLVKLDVLIHLIHDEKIVGRRQLVGFHVQKSSAAGAALSDN